MSTFDVTITPPTTPAPAPVKKPRTRKPKIKVTYLKLWDVCSGKPKGLRRPTPDPARREAEEIDALRRFADELLGPAPTYLSTT
jgi:hypothetical protein